MTDALLAIDRDISAGKWQTQPQTEGGDSRETSLYHMQPEVSLSLADAWDAEKEEIPLAQAAGRIAGDFRESVSSRNSGAGTGRTDRRDPLPKACGVFQKGSEGTGSHRKRRILHYRSQKLAAERI